jgi:protein SCO1
MVPLLGGCDSTKPSFKSTDVTGATYARDFKLTDHTGTARTLADYRGKVVAVFFGFTRCPDVCPTTLAQTKLALGKLGDDAKRVQVVFVTVDPERDTQDVLSAYVTGFDPSFVGLRGTAVETATIAKDFKVFYQKSAGTTPENYSVDHTAATYVFDPSGRLRLFVRHSAAIDDLVADFRILLDGK